MSDSWAAVHADAVHLRAKGEISVRGKGRRFIYCVDLVLSGLDRKPTNAEDSSRRGPRQCATQRTRWRGPRSGRNQLNETSFRWRSGYGLSSRLSALLAMVQAPSTTAGVTAKGSSARPEHSNGATPPTPRRRRRPSTPGLRSWLMRCRLRGPGWGQQGGGRAERRCRRWDSSVVRRRRRLLREAQVRQP